MKNIVIHSDNYQKENRAFLYGDAVKVHFFLKSSFLVLAEECYFFLMASMRKMRMNIPLTYTLDFFQKMFHDSCAENNIKNGTIAFTAYRNNDGLALEKSTISYVFQIYETVEPFLLQPPVEVDVHKEISVNTHLLSSIHVHSPENIYAEIYAKENNLDDVILLNPNKKIARTVFGNLLFLEEKSIKVTTQNEGAYISPLMESFLTFIHRKNLAEIVPTEIVAFETQKADEILIISDAKGIFPVHKIRNKKFEWNRFNEMISLWNQSI